MKSVEIAERDDASRQMIRDPAGEGEALHSPGP
jgi:hypothetical protein